MGIIRNLFGGENSNDSKPKINWISLTTNEQLDAIVEKSQTKTQAIFKHSTRCGISTSVLRRFEDSTAIEAIDFYFLDLLRYRTVSNEIANTFQVIHESPQLLIIKKGVVVAHDSHGGILNLQFT